MDKKVRLAHVSDEHLDCLNTFELPEEQVQYTRLPRDVSDLQEWQYPIVILAGEEPVGFFLLHRTERVKEFTGNPDAILLTAFSIDYRQQGKGYTKIVPLRTYIGRPVSQIQASGEWAREGSNSLCG